MQGGYQMEGDGEWPTFSPGEWVRTNSGYGYGCVCLDVRVDREEKRIVEIRKASPRPLDICRRDPGLAKWREHFK